MILMSTKGLAQCIVQIIIICALGKYLAGTIPALILVLFFVQRYYVRTSRQLRLLDIEARSPLVTHSLETLHGISVVRAMRWQAPFQERFQESLDSSQKPFYLLLCIQHWLQLVLDCIVMFLAVILAALVISFKDQFSPGAIGVALNLILTFNQDLMLLMRFWTSLETSIGAVSRIQNFVSDTASEDQRPENLRLVPTKWPIRGQVAFHDVKATYKYVIAFGEPAFLHTLHCLFFITN